MELAGYLAVARRWWATLLIATWVAGLAGYFIASGVPPTYEGTTRLLVGPVVGDVDVTRAAGAISFTYAELAVTEPARAEVAAELGLPPTAIIARAIPNETTRILEIRAEYGSPETAAAIANALGQRLIDAEGSGVELPEGRLAVVEPAAPNPEPIAPQVMLIALVAAATGLVAATVLVLLVEYFGNTVTSAQELAKLSGRHHGLVSLDKRFRPTPERASVVEGRPESRAAASVRMMASKLAFPRSGEGTSSALIVGTAPHDGTADLALGIAIALARAGRRVLLIDGNREFGELSELVGMDGHPGLAELLSQSDSPVANFLRARSRGPTILARGGGASQTDLIDPDSAEALLTQSLREFDMVLVVTAPVHLSGNALVWGGLVQRVLLVAERDRAKRNDVEYAVESLEATAREFFGAVLIEKAPRRVRQSRSSSQRNAGSAATANARRPQPSRRSQAGDPTQERTSNRLGS